VQEKGNEWCNYLQTAALSLRTTIHTGTGTPPSLLIFGKQLTIPQDISFNATTTLELKNLLRGINDLHEIALRNQRTTYPAKGRNSCDLTKGDFVWVKTNQKSKFAANYHGPYQITKPVTDKNHITIKTDNIEKTISSYNIKKCVPIESYLNTYPNQQIEIGKPYSQEPPAQQDNNPQQQ